MVLLTSLLFLCTYCGLSKAQTFKSFYVKQKVDHFSYANNDYFRQRFILNMDNYHFHGAGCVFVYAGNEGGVEMFLNNTGFIWEHAAMFNAAVVFLEHRYYGKSLPYGDLAYKNKTFLGYLTSEQALADYAILITKIKDFIPLGREVPFIVFGGSYGGMLAAWLRIKYPHLVDGAIASSAPILQFGESVPCNKFVEIVTQDFEKEGLECVKSIRKSWAIIRRIYNEPSGKELLKQKFHLCGNYSFDIDDLISWISDTWSFMAMLDYPYPTNFLIPLPAYPIKEACKKLKNSSIPDEDILFNIYQAVSVYHNYTGQATCYNLSSSGSKLLGEAGWQFQACTEMIQPVCQTGVSDMFEPLQWNFTFFAEKCFKRYGVIPDINKTTIFYGGDALKSASNIVFTNGLLDPWYAGGILKSISDTVVAIVIKDAAHHLDLKSSNPADPPSVIDARQQIIEWIKYFIQVQRWNT